MFRRILATSFISLILSLFFSASSFAAAAEVRIVGLRVTKTAIEYDIRTKLTTDQVKNITALEIGQRLKKADTTDSAKVDEKFTPLAKPYSTTDQRSVSVSLTPDQIQKLGDKATISVFLYDATDAKSRKLIAQTTLSFAVSSNVQPDNLASFKANYTFTEKDGNYTAIVSWDEVKNASYYTITRTNPDKTKTVVANSLTKQNNENITNLFDNLEATDTFSVSAYQEVNGRALMIAQASANSSQVARASTEFGNLANIGQYVQKVMKYALPVGITLAVIMGMYAGITLMLSQGSPDKIKSSKEGIQGAIIGLVLLILVRLLVDFLYIPSINTTPDTPSFFSHFIQERNGGTA